MASSLSIVRFGASWLLTEGWEHVCVYNAGSGNALGSFPSPESLSSSPGLLPRAEFGNFQVVVTWLGASSYFPFVYFGACNVHELTGHCMH